MLPEFARMIAALSDGRVDYILVGGLAAITHGSSRVTGDVDIVYSRSAENLEGLALALSPYDPYLRGAPEGLPFRLDAPTIRAGLNFTLRTNIGDIDLLGEITGGGFYDDLVPYTKTYEVQGHPVKVLALPKLIEVKRAAGRPKDFEAIAELEEILQGELPR